MSYICNTCTASFKNKSSLNAHVKSAKYCLKLRETTATIIPSFICDVCEKTFTTKQHLQQHYQSCCSHHGYIKYKVLYSSLQVEKQQLQAEYLHFQKLTEKQLSDKDVMIDKLRADMQQLSMEAVKRPSTVNNTNNNVNTTNINNLAVFDRNQLVDAVQRNPLNKEIVDKGLPGVAGHVGYLLKTEFEKPNYMIADASRLKCKYKNADGNIITDHKCNAIVSSISPHLSDQATDVFQDVASSYELRLNIHNLENNKIPTLQNYIKQVEKQIDDLPDRRTQNHPDRQRFNKLLEDYNDDLKDYFEQLNSLKQAALIKSVRLDIPLESYEEDLDKTSRNLKDIKQITGETKTSFAKSLIHTIS
jgi:hypothetical protein